jgi:hypothetical protein
MVAAKAILPSPSKKDSDVRVEEKVFRFILYYLWYVAKIIFRI